MNEIIIDVGFKQDRVAILEHNELVELHIEKVGAKKLLGNVFKGRVINVLPGMEAAFVDILRARIDRVKDTDRQVKEFAKVERKRKKSSADSDLSEFMEWR